MVAAALRAECRLFVSEDMHDGAVVDGMRIANPFSAEFAEVLGRK